MKGVGCRCACSFNHGCSDKQEDVLVGAAGPMTGGLAAFGEQLKRGAEMAVADINAQGGILGKKLKLEIGDDACDPKQAVTVANQMATKKVVFVAGHFCSGSSIPASAVYAENGILQITPASTNPLLTEDAIAKGIKTVFRTCGRDDAQGVFAGQWLAKEYQGKRVAILHDKSTYGKGLADETKKNMNAAGLQEVMYEAYTAGEKDYSALVSKMKAAGIDAFYLGGYHPEGALILRQAREQGLMAQFVGADAINDKEFGKIAGAASDGAFFTFAPEPRNKPQAKAVVDKFKAQNYDPEGYTLYSYAAFQVWAQAVKEAGTFDAAKVAEKIHGKSFDTVIGNLQYDDKGDVANAEYVFYEWKDGDYKQR
ncbi:MAG: branched-chain amino acid ABC transporter substrate-binding protein [Alphaproteobacteria bacterium]